MEQVTAALDGYDALGASGVVLGLFKEGVGQVDALGEGDEGVIVLDETPFYAESGGQVGDRGRIEGDGLALEVLDTQVSGGGPVCQVKVLQGDLQAPGLEKLDLLARVDTDKRRATMRNHTATHLLHAALHKHLGEHATQGLVPRGIEGMMIGTFHSTCARILRRETDNLLGYQDNFVIFDTDDQKRLLKQVLADLKIDPKQFTPQAARGAISASSTARSSATRPVRSGPSTRSIRTGRYPRFRRESCRRSPGVYPVPRSGRSRRRKGREKQRPWEPSPRAETRQSAVRSRRPTGNSRCVRRTKEVVPAPVLPCPACRRSAGRAFLLPAQCLCVEQYLPRARGKFLE